jgi:hypothetical protein
MKLIDIKQLSAELGPPVRTLRSLMQSRKIPYIRAGYRTCLFNIEKVQQALAKLEVRAVSEK